MRSARTNIKSTGLSTDPNSREPKPSEGRFVLCVRNKNYSASLGFRKIYQLIWDDVATKHRQLRVIDESGENYLYPEEYFIPIKLPSITGKP
jgi:hypothetical protein